MAAAAATIVGSIEAVRSPYEIRTYVSGASGNISWCRPNSSLVPCFKWRGASLDARGGFLLSRSLGSAAADEFSDQGHLQFYAETVRQKYNRKSRSRAIYRSSLRQSVLQAIKGSVEAGVSDGFNVCTENPGVSDRLNICLESIDGVKDAMKQLKALEEEIKSKKKKLKAKKKEMKAEKEIKCESSSSSSESNEGGEEIIVDKMKNPLHDSKEIKKKKRQIKAEVKCKRKSTCDSSSSSSSESSDCEDEMCMDQVRTQLQEPAVVEPLADLLTTVPFPQTKELPAQTIGYSPFTVSNKEIATFGVTSSVTSSIVVESSATSADVQSSGRVEVCTGGKCRKDGSQQVLSAFQEVIPSTSRVVVSACKCMGKCGKGPNVRVHSGEANSVPQVYTAVSEEDAKFLSHYHFDVTPEHGIAVIPVPDTDLGVRDTSIYAA